MAPAVALRPPTTVPTRGSPPPSAPRCLRPTAPRPAVPPPARRSGPPTSTWPSPTAPAPPAPRRARPPPGSPALVARLSAPSTASCAAARTAAGPAVSGASAPRPACATPPPGADRPARMPRRACRCARPAGTAGGRRRAPGRGSGRTERAGAGVCHHAQMPLVALLIFTLAETGVPAPVQVTYATSPAPLRGFLYRPAGPGPFPALVFNHGSERDASDLRGQAVFYVPRGFVVFVPHRRGHGLSGGEYYDDVWKRSGRQPAKLVELLDAQVDDVAAAVAWVGRLAYVDRTRVVLAGCSFGGI